MFCSGQNSSITKDDNFLIYAKESYGSLKTVSLLIEIYLPLKFQADTCYTCSCCVMLRTQLNVKNYKGQ